jgi:hypothetical protein
MVCGVAATPPSPEIGGNLTATRRRSHLSGIFATEHATAALKAQIPRDNDLIMRQTGNFIF